jgi:hypothetical protein
MIFASHRLLQLVKGRGFNSHSVHLFAGVAPRGSSNDELTIATSFWQLDTVILLLFELHVIKGELRNDTAAGNGHCALRPDV